MAADAAGTVPRPDGGRGRAWDERGRRRRGRLRRRRCLRRHRGRRGRRRRAGPRPVRRRRRDRAVRRRRLRRRRHRPAARGRRARTRPRRCTTTCSQEVGDAVSPATLRRFCAGSADMIAWLAERGVPFDGSLCPYKTSYPTNRHYLYYSGSELSYRDVAAPAPRGHRTRGRGTSGKLFYARLAATARARGVRVLAQTSAVAAAHRRQPAGSPGWSARTLRRAPRLGPDGAPDPAPVVGQARPLPARARPRAAPAGGLAGAPLRPPGAGRGPARRGAGRRRLRVQPARCCASTRRRTAAACRWAHRATTAAASGSAPRPAPRTGQLDRVTIWRFLTPPAALLHGAAGGPGRAAGLRRVPLRRRDRRRRAAQPSRPGVAAGRRDDPGRGPPPAAQPDAVVPAAAGVVAARRSTGSARRRWPAVAARAGVDPDGLAATVKAYHAAVAAGGPDPAGKPPELVRPLDRPPYSLIDCSMRPRLAQPAPMLTLGGLRRRRGDRAGAPGGRQRRCPGSTPPAAPPSASAPTPTSAGCRWPTASSPAGARAGTRHAYRGRTACSTEAERSTLADRLYAAERDRAPIAPLVETAPGPRRRPTPTRSSCTTSGAAAAAVVGHKVGLSSAAMQQMMGVDEPDYGHLLADMRLSEDVPVDAGRYCYPRVEIEVAFLLGADLPGAGLHRGRRARRHRGVRAVDRADRQPDRGLADQPGRHHRRQRLLGRVRGRRGAGRPDDSGHPRRSTRRCTATARRSRSGRSDAVLGNPVTAVAWLARTVAGFGVRLRAGPPRSCPARAPGPSTPRPGRRVPGRRSPASATCRLSFAGGGGDGVRSDARRSSGRATSAPTCCTSCCGRTLIEPRWMVGIDPDSPGLRRAADAGPGDQRGRRRLAAGPGPAARPRVRGDVGAVHRANAPRYAEAGIRAVDLTPAAVGPVRGPAGQPRRPPRRAERQPDHLRRAGHDPDGVRGVPGDAGRATPRSWRRWPRARPARAPGRTSTSSPGPPAAGSR